MRRSWMLVGGVGGMLLVSTLLARPGIVKTRDGQTVAGDVTEQPDQILVDRRGIHTAIDRDNLRSITYSDTVEQETRKRLAKLTPYDVAGRVELSQWLFENKAYDLAMSVLDNAAAIQPRNEDVIAMRRTVQRQILLDESEARKHAPVQLAAADNRPPAGAAPGRADAAAPAPGANPGRVLTPEEINHVRQAEWQDGQWQVHVTFRDDVRHKYVASSGVEANTFNRMPPAQQAWAIVKNGTPEMKKDVILTTDPPSMAAYKKVQQSLIYTGCANCHSGNKAQGNFSLHFPANNDAQTYANFVILQKYQAKIGDRQYLMIDRTQPDASLLVQFALPPEAGQPPHPKAANYKGAVHSKADARLKAAIDWISALNPVTPDYSDIDLAPKQGSERPMVPAPPSHPVPPRR